MRALHNPWFLAERSTRRGKELRWKQRIAGLRLPGCLALCGGVGKAAECTDQVLSPHPVTLAQSTAPGTSVSSPLGSVTLASSTPQGYFEVQIRL